MDGRDESRIRRLAARDGYRVRKSRRQHTVNNWGEFMLIKADTNVAVLGVRFDASLEEIESFLRDDDSASSAESGTVGADGQRRAV